MGTQRKKSNSNGIKFKESLPERNLVLHEQDEDHYAQAMPLTLTPEQQERVVDFMTGVADLLEETTPQERITSRLALQFLAAKDFAVQPSVNLYKNFSRLIHQHEINSPYFLQLSHFVSLLSLSLPPEILALSTISPRSSFSLPTPSTSWFYPFSSKSTSATTIEPPAKLTKEPTVEDDAIESVTHEPNVITSPLSNTPAPLFYLPGTHDRQGNTILIFNARIAGTVIDQDLLKRLFSVILFLTDRACNS
ncbi:hypothetical protein HK098_001473 [Nowakowskiella sp. JEL0407]|nr:hypothetical protein HK098_001473 [Nowakowskiella sp. JEL0407]